MLPKSKIQYLRSLHDRHTRYELGRFLVEGKKSIFETLDSSFRIVEGFVAHDFIPPLKCDFPIELVSEKELHQISSLTSNRDGVLVVEMPQNFWEHKRGAITLVLDGINDPGNLGTIIRTADWYGITEIVASEDTVDVYNPKTIIASMGSFTRVRVEYKSLQDFLQKQSGMIVWAFLGGESIYRQQFDQDHLTLVIGSESHGIRPSIAPYITHQVMIPRIGGAESLNAGIATAIFLDRIVGGMRGI